MVIHYTRYVHNQVAILIMYCTLRLNSKTHLYVCVSFIEKEHKCQLWIEFGLAVQMPTSVHSLGLVVLNLEVALYMYK